MSDEAERRPAEELTVRELVSMLAPDAEHAEVDAALEDEAEAPLSLCVISSDDGDMSLVVDLLRQSPFGPVDTFRQDLKRHRDDLCQLDNVSLLLYLVAAVMKDGRYRLESMRGRQWEWGLPRQPELFCCFVSLGIRNQSDSRDQGGEVCLHLARKREKKDEKAEERMEVVDAVLRIRPGTPQRRELGPLAGRGLFNVLSERAAQLGTPDLQADLLKQARRRPGRPRS